jgi:hypothetical protein
MWVGYFTPQTTNFESRNESINQPKRISATNRWKIVWEIVQSFEVATGQNKIHIKFGENTPKGLNFTKTAKEASQIA